MLRRWKAKWCWDNPEIHTCRKQPQLPGLWSVGTQAYRGGVPKQDAGWPSWVNAWNLREHHNGCSAFREGSPQLSSEEAPYAWCLDCGWCYSGGYRWHGSCWWETEQSWKPKGILFPLISPSNLHHSFSLTNQKSARCLENVVCRLPALPPQSRNGGEENGDERQ